MKQLLIRGFLTIFLLLCAIRVFADVVIVCDAQGCHPVVIFKEQAQPYMANPQTGQWVYPQ